MRAPSQSGEQQGGQGVAHGGEPHRVQRGEQGLADQEEAAPRRGGGFVYHRLDNALAHNPAIVVRLGALRAQRWSIWWRANISGLSANVTLGLMLGLAPVLLAFIGLPIEVRHVTLSAGQLAAAISTLGWPTLLLPAFSWCVAGLVATGLLNLGVSFWLALKVALRSRRITLNDRQRLYAAVWRRLRSAPGSFLLPD
jgi:site-specific recombinase